MTMAEQAAQNETVIYCVMFFRYIGNSMLLMLLQDTVNAAKLTKTDVERMLAGDDVSLKLISFEDLDPKKHGKLRSKCWENFKRVHYEETPLNFVVCNGCSLVFIFNTAHGTSSFHRHSCGSDKKTKDNDNKTGTIARFFKKSVPKPAIQKLNDDIVVGLAIDLRPLSSVEKEGFLRLAQSFINLGAKFGAVSASDVIQHRTTLTRNRLPGLCEQIREKIKSDLHGAPSYPKFAFSSDMWMDKYESTHFLSLNVHYINNDWELKKTLLGMNQFDDKKTTANIRRDCEAILEDYFEPDEVTNVILNSVSVTDGGKNMLKVFPRQKPCMCHRLNLFVEWTLNNNELSKTERNKYLMDKTAVPPKKLFKLSASCPKVEQSLNSLKSLVTFVKRSGINSELSTTLKQDVVTRWNSVHISIISYLKVSDEVKEVLLKRDKLEHIAGINDSSLKELRNFLDPIAECSEILSGDTYPTIQLVALFFHQLTDHIQINVNDSAELRILKRQAALCFQEYCLVEDFHYMAAMFDPR